MNVVSSLVEDKLSLLEENIKSPRDIAQSRIRMLEASGKGFAAYLVSLIQEASESFFRRLALPSSIVPLSERLETSYFDRLLRVHSAICQLDSTLSEELGREGSDCKQGGGSPVKIKSRLPSVKRMTKSPPLSENEMASHIHHEYYEPKEAASPAHDKKVPERVSSLFRQRRDKETNDEGNSDIQGKSAAPKKLSERLASFFRQRSEDEIDDDEGFDEGPTTMKKFSPPKSARKKTAGILT